MRQSKAFAWGAMIVMIIVIIITMCSRIVSSLWEYSVLFLAFMTVFCHLAAVLLVRVSQGASKKLDVAACIFGILAVIALVVVFILDWSVFY